MYKCSLIIGTLQLLMFNCRQISTSFLSYSLQGSNVPLLCADAHTTDICA